MGKTPRKVNRALLENLIREIDNPNLSTRAELYDLVSTRYNSEVVDFPNITPSIVMLRINEWKLELKTPKGKRGRVGGVPSGTNKTSRKRKFKDSKLFNQWRESMLKDCPDKGGWINKISDGSMKYAIRLNCYTCSGYDASEALHCDNLACPFWMFLTRKERQDS